MEHYPIRVLHVVTHMNRGGLESMIMNYYRAIDRSKLQFDFLTHRPAYEEKDYNAEIRSLGGRIFHVPALNPFSRKYLQSLDAFFINHPEYKIVHVHQDCMSSLALHAAQKAGVPVRIAHCHTSNQDKNLKLLLKKTYKKRIPYYATDLIACGKQAGQWMFGEKKHFEILHNAISTKQYVFSEQTRTRIRESLQLKADDIVIGHVGRFSKVKNHVFLIQLIEALAAVDPRYKLLLIGDGELADDIKTRVTSIGLQDNVLFLGLRTDVPELLQAMDVFVLPSLYEGVPVSIIEAQAAGLKCFVSDAVPKDCMITDLVSQLDLSDPIETWVRAIMEGAEYERTDRTNQITQAGYDIENNARYLQDFYLRSIQNY